MILRAYQQRAVDQLRACYASGRRAPVLCLPTAAGKTVVSAEIIRLALAKKNRVLFAAGRVELLNQAVRKLADAGVTDVRVIQADNITGAADAAVTVASIPTLATKRWMAALPPADLVIADEVQHGIARTWHDFLRCYASSRLLGLSATPQRGDGRGLGEIFDAIVVGASVRELTDLGHLVRCRVFAPPRVLEARELALDPFEAYERYANKQPTIVFAQTKQHARSIADSFDARGIRVATVFGDSTDREATLAGLGDGTIDVLVGVGVFIEGWDCTAATVAIFARKFTHVGSYLQAIGRLLRPHPGKQEAIVVDLVGSALVHGTPDIDREYSLDGAGISSSRLAIRQCQRCGGVFQDAPKCTYCGFAAPPLARKDPKATGEGVSALAPKTQARPWFVPMEAKFAGVCATCVKRINKGDEIVWAKGQKPRHVACAKRRAA